MLTLFSTLRDGGLILYPDKKWTSFVARCQTWMFTKLLLHVPDPRRRKQAQQQSSRLWSQNNKLKKAKVLQISARKYSVGWWLSGFVTLSESVHITHKIFVLMWKYSSEQLWVTTQRRRAKLIFHGLFLKRKQKVIYLIVTVLDTQHLSSLGTKTWMTSAQKQCFIAPEGWSCNKTLPK